MTKIESKLSKLTWNVMKQVTITVATSRMVETE